MEEKLEIKKIVRVEAKANSALLFYENGYSEVVGNSIDELEKEFIGLNFVRIHPRHLINPTYYYKISKFITPAIEMTDGTLLPADKNLIDISEFSFKKDSLWDKILQALNIKH